MEIKDILSIIRACNANGVQELVLDKLKLSFFPKTASSSEASEPLAANISTAIPKPVTVPAVVEKRMDEVAAEENKKAAIRDVEDEIDELRLTNPLEYEERLARGELVDDPQVRH